MSGPSYIDLTECSELARRAARARQLLVRCTLCPRACKANRLADECGLCGVGRLARVASYGPHHGEERCLSGVRGSGTIFFAYCNLGCAFCQNWEISHSETPADRAGDETEAAELADMMIRLQKMGCHNINLVTPSHVVPQVLEALVEAARRGLRLPLVFNTSAYDSLVALHLLDAVVDIYMPDFKCWDSEKGERLLAAGDYPDVARRAITEMHRQVGDLVVDANGLAQRGLLVRHLVMPGGLQDSAEIFAWLARLSSDTYVNVMRQYRPEGLVLAEPARYEEIARRVSASEHREALALAAAAGLRRAGLH